MKIILKKENTVAFRLLGAGICFTCNDSPKVYMKMEQLHSSLTNAIDLQTGKQHCFDLNHQVTVVDLVARPE